MNKTGVSSFAKSLLQKLPIQDKIIFESRPDFACNTYPVYLKFREKYPKIKLVWMVKEKTQNSHHADGLIEMSPKTIWSKIKAVYHLYTSKGLVSSNIVIDKRRKEQVSLFLGHGSKTKHTKGFYEPGKAADYVQVQSHFFDDITMEEYSCIKEQLVYLGYPRCDCFFQQENKHVPFTNGEQKRYLIWLPTVRKRKNGMEDVDCSGYDEIGMPLIYSQDMLVQFNDFLQKHDTFILYKPHPTQDISMLTSQRLSHIQILTDADLAEKDIQLYEIIAQSSALITDYSSVFYDYLLLNRPIATTTDDIENWKNGRGFAFNLEKIYDEATDRVSTLEELEAFIVSVIDGKDEKAEARNTYCDLTNMYRDGNSAERVADFMIEKIKNLR